MRKVIRDMSPKQISVYVCVCVRVCKHFYVTISFEYGVIQIKKTHLHTSNREEAEFHTKMFANCVYIISSDASNTQNIYSPSVWRYNITEPNYITVK